MTASEFFICFGAFLIALLFVRIGLRSGAFTALSRMLPAVLSLFIALRCWFPVSRWVVGYKTVPLPILAVAVFWALFFIATLVFSKLLSNYVEKIESVFESALDHALGALFGAVHGAVFATALMLTLSIAAPLFWPAYQPAALPLPIDRVPLMAYRFVEKRAADIGEHDPAHTLLPAMKQADAADPAAFWR